MAYRYNIPSEKSEGGRGDQARLATLALYAAQEEKGSRYKTNRQSYYTMSKQ
jgi:hypothetical protein